VPFRADGFYQPSRKIEIVCDFHVNFHVKNI
jgi:hypothetical protein